PVTKGWRLMLRVKVKDAKKTTEMRAALVNADQTLSETWSYQLSNWIVRLKRRRWILARRR
ncbi:glucan biosynthesis protein, partial [Salmonella enterica subsp. enterica serovar Montevideo]|nr:glucan biosynthesis protein [Salmonella enterica subsp. enterica serovar Montevideo]